MNLDTAQTVDADEAKQLGPSPLGRDVGPEVNPPPLDADHYYAIGQESDASGSLYGESEGGEEFSAGEIEDEPLSLKRPAEETLVPRPFKRHKGVLNTDYLDLLNRDIEDAAHRVMLAEEADLQPTQLGMTVWSPMEKKLFFESLSRLGRDDLPGIVSSIGTKSEVEVNHYIHTLRTARILRQREGLRPPLELAEYPAAVELSQQCCHALDEAADAISVRQERKEEQREEGKWGELWDITPRTARMLDKGEKLSDGQQLACSKIFNLAAWLRVAERIFMNSSIPGENWSFFDNHPPSMWATTLEDFHSLTLSITRRLVQTTLFMAMTRIRAKKELQPGVRGIVRQKDVEAAIASLGMVPNTHDFWKTCARRLRLDVFEEPPDREEDGDEEPLSYDEVEHALALEPTMPEQKPEVAPEQTKQESSSESELPDDSDLENDGLESDAEEAALNQEANEVLRYSAADFPETHRTKQSLKNRIATERQQELYAEECDQYASYQAECQMWELLQKKPPIELPKVQEPGPLQRSKKDVESIYPIGRDWRSRTQYQNEWEAGHN